MFWMCSKALGLEEKVLLKKRIPSCFSKLYQVRCITLGNDSNLGTTDRRWTSAADGLRSQSGS